MKHRPIFAALLILTLAAGCRPSEPESKSATPTPAATPAATPELTPAPAPAPGDLTPATSDLGGTPAQETGLPADRPLRAAFLVVDGVYNTELMAPYDVFQHTSAHAQPGIQVFTVSPDG